MQISINLEDIQIQRLLKDSEKVLTTKNMEDIMVQLELFRQRNRTTFDRGRLSLYSSLKSDLELLCMKFDPRLKNKIITKMRTFFSGGGGSN